MLNRVLRIAVPLATTFALCVPLNSASADPGPPSRCVDWTGDVAPIIADANARMAAYPDAKLRRWFELPRSAGKAKYYHAFVNALPTVAHARRGSDLGRVRVVYDLLFKHDQRAYSVVLRYRDGCRSGITKVGQPAVGSLGFPNRPRTDLNAALRHIKVFRREHTDVIPAGYRLQMAQLQKADAPPPTLGQKRWIVSYAKPGYYGVQLIVTMDGKVAVGAP